MCCRGVSAVGQPQAALGLPAAHRRVQRAAAVRVRPGGPHPPAGRCGRRAQAQECMQHHLQHCPADVCAEMCACMPWIGQQRCGAAASGWLSRTLALDSTCAADLPATSGACMVILSKARLMRRRPSQQRRLACNKSNMYSKQDKGGLLFEGMVQALTLALDCMH